MSDLLERHKVFKRLGYLWAMVMISQVVMFYTGQPLGTAGTADGVIITAVVGLFGYGLKSLSKSGGID